MANKVKYQRFVGRLIYLSHTHLDIVFAVSMVSKFMHSPKPEQFDVVYKILTYLTRTPRRDLPFRKYDHTKIEVYIDVDRAGS